MNELENVKQNALAMFENAGSWIEWQHEGTQPAKTNLDKAFNIILALSSHCPTCLNLNGCWFRQDNMPEIPLHPNCHCTSRFIPTPKAGITAIAELPITKLTKYAFDNTAKKHFLQAMDMV